MHIGTPIITAAMTVEDVLDQFPRTIPVFVSRRMQCVGCPMARFETLSEACAIYRLSSESLLAELNAIVRADMGRGESRST